jgi:hypothetical protein
LTCIAKVVIKRWAIVLFIIRQFGHYHPGKSKTALLLSRLSPSANYFIVVVLLLLSLLWLFYYLFDFGIWQTSIRTQ